MKIILYTTTECQFSKQEKEYFTSHTLQYEEKNLETNREFLTEMLAVSNNFAGTPVTKIEKDDGSIVVLKGFTKDEFDKTLGFAVAPEETLKTADPQVTAAQAQVPQTPQVQPTVPAAQDPIQPPPVQITPPPVVPSPVPQAPVSQPTAPPAPVDAPIASPDPLNSILTDLQSKVNGAQPADTQAPPNPASIPDFKQN